MAEIIQISFKTTTSACIWILISRASWSYSQKDAGDSNTGHQNPPEEGKNTRDVGWGAQHLSSWWMSIHCPEASNSNDRSLWFC